MYLDAPEVKKWAVFCHGRRNTGRLRFLWLYWAWTVLANQPLFTG